MYIYTYAHLLGRRKALVDRGRARDGDVYVYVCVYIYNIIYR